MIKRPVIRLSLYGMRFKYDEKTLGKNNSLFVSWDGLGHLGCWICVVVISSDLWCNRWAGVIFRCVDERKAFPL